MTGSLRNIDQTRILGHEVSLGKENIEGNMASQGSNKNPPLRTSMFGSLPLHGGTVHVLHPGEGLHLLERSVGVRENKTKCGCGRRYGHVGLLSFVSLFCDCCMVLFAMYCLYCCLSLFFWVFFFVCNISVVCLSVLVVVGSHRSSGQSPGN